MHLRTKEDKPFHVIKLTSTFSNTQKADLITKDVVLFYFHSFYLYWSQQPSTCMDKVKRLYIYWPFYKSGIGTNQIQLAILHLRRAFNAVLKRCEKELYLPMDVYCTDSQDLALSREETL